MIRKFSISDKLILASLILSTVTIMIVASYSFFNARKAILERTFNQLTSLRLVKANLLENFFYNSLKQVQLTKSSSDIKSIVNQINKIENSSNYVTLIDSSLHIENPFINEVLSKNFTGISIVGKNKVIYNIIKSNSSQIKSNQDYDSLWKYSISNTSPNIKDLSKEDELNHHIITISSSIFDSLNNAIGIIVFEISQQSIDSIMVDNNPANGLGTSGESYLVGKDFLMRSSSRFHHNSILSTIVKTQSVENAFNNLTGTNIINDYRGIKVLSSYGKIDIPNLDWAILTEIDFEEATIPIYRIRNEIVFISIFIFLMVLVVVFVLSRRITFPIQRLNHAVKEVGSGNLDVEIKNNLNDEIGELTDTFNKMIHQLKDQTKELEDERLKNLRSLINGQESERQRLSRELHDSLGQLLIGLKLKYESCLIKSKSINLENESFTDLGLLFDQTIEETRRISNNLMPAALAEFGIVTAIRNICNEFSESTDINIKYTTKGNNKTLKLIEKIYIFRITQEALTNIIKHSKAKNALVNISFHKSKINITISDDGCGFNKTKVNLVKSNGLNNIKDRISLLSGTYSIDSSAKKGTKISIHIPIGNNIDG